VEPVFYVLLLFLLRSHPIALALVGAVMVVHRETTALALVALAIIEISRAASWRTAALRWIGTAGLCAAVVFALRLLSRWSTNYGGIDIGFALTQDASNSLSWLVKDTTIILGLMPHDVHDTGLVLPFVEGSVGSLVAFGVLAVLALWNGRQLLRLRSADNRTAFGAYLILTCALVALAFAGRQMWHDTLLIRYLLVLVLLPAALATLALAGQPQRWRRAATCAALAWLVGANVVANAGYYRRLDAARLPDPLNDVADYLEANGVTIGLAPYWVAYNLTFRTGGRVHIASSDVVRIPAYQEEYDASPDRAVRIDAGPCAPAKLVTISGIHLCMP
jgi:hypothetical protein